MDNRWGAAGFSLIELVVTVSVVAILGMIAFPSFQNITKNSRLASETNDLMSDLSLARTEAAKRGARVTVCVSTDQTSCSSGAAWTGGRIVFVDAGTYGTVDSGDEILRVSQPQSNSSVSITVSGFSVSSTSTLNYIQFRPAGSLNSDTTGKFKICDDRAGAFGREIEILKSGRVSLKTTTSSCP